MPMGIAGPPVARVALIVALAALAGCGASGSSGPAGKASTAATASAAPTTASAATPAAVATPRSAQTASDLLDSALSAVQAETSVHIDCTLPRPTGEDRESEDIGVASGRVVNTDGSVSITIMLVGGVAYQTTNTPGVLSAQGVPEAEAEKLAGEWISIRPGDSYGQAYLNYVTAIHGMTLGSQADALRVTGVLRRTGPTRAQGVAVYGVSGDATPYYGVTGATETVYIAASGAPLPVSVTSHSGSSTTQTCTYSNWGKPLNLTAPAHAVPLTSIPK